MGSNPFSSFFEGLVVDATPRTAREWAMLAPEVRMGRFFLSSVEDEFLLNAVRDLCRSAMERGISDGEFVREAWGMLRRLRASCDMPTVEFMPEGLSPEEVQRYQGDVRNVDSIARLQLIFRTQCDVAAGYREFRQAFDPVRLQGYPGWRFVRQPGARVKRPDHVAHEGAVRLKTDIEFWLARNSPEQGGFNNPFPPFGFNSWMLVEEVPREECEALGLLAPGEPVEVPAEYARFGLDVVLANSARASVRALPEDARRRIVQRNEDEGIRISPAEDDPDVFEVTGTVLEDDDFFRELDEIERALMEDVEARRLSCNQYVKDSACRNPHGASRAKKKRTDWQTEGLDSLDRMDADVCAEVASTKEILQKINVEKLKGKPGGRAGFKQKKPLFQAKCFDGGALVIDADTIAHIVNDHIGGEPDFRMRHFPKVLATLENPVEVWRQPSGARVFIGVFETNGNSGRLALAVVEKAHHLGRVYTFFCNSDAATINRQRYGENIYSRDKNRQR